jgi:hypothetical protein
MDNFFSRTETEIKSLNSEVGLYLSTYLALNHILNPVGKRERNSERSGTQVSRPDNPDYVSCYSYVQT